MYSPEGSPTPETDPVYSELLDTVAVVFDEAFGYVKRNEGRGVADWIHIDKFSAGTHLYSVLLSPTGGKPEEGVEMIRLLVQPRDPSLSVKEAAEKMFHEEMSELVFDASTCFIEHRFEDGTKKYLKATERGFEPWVPLHEMIGPLGELAVLPADFSVDDIVQAKKAAQNQPSKKAEQLEALDKKYARELKKKISPDARSPWHLVPQN